MKLRVVKAGGLQESSHVKHSKIVDQSYSEFLVLVPELFTPGPLGWDDNSEESYTWKHHTHWS